MNPWIKRLGIGLAGLVTVVLVAVACVYALSEMRFRHTYALTSERISVPTDSASIARGRHLATAIGKCVECHGERLQGQPIIDGPPFGRLSALNITTGKGGVLASLSDADLERAIRHGIGHDGRPLKIMPSDDYQYMSDADVGALIAYIRSVPPADHVVPPTALQLLPRALLVAGVMPLLKAEKIMKAGPPRKLQSTPAPTREYGEYLANVGGCTGCHGPGLSGGKIAEGDPSWPPAANLTSAGHIGQWTEAQFVQTLRTGHRPDGSALNAAMPWKLAAQMTDDEFHALWLYLRSVPAKEFGNH